MSTLSPLTSKITPSTAEISDPSEFRKAVEKKVLSNIQNKLFGSTGGAVVCFHSRQPSDLSECRSISIMKELQMRIESIFGALKPSLPRNTLNEHVKTDPYRGNISDLERLHQGCPKYFVVSKTGDGIAYRESSSEHTGFVKIRNLHTTITTQHVIETSKGEEGWEEKTEVAKYYRAFVDFHDLKPEGFAYLLDGQICTKEHMLTQISSCDNLSQILGLLESSDLTEADKDTLRTLSEKGLVESSEELDAIPEIKLVATEIKVTDNGSLIVQWGANDMLPRLRKILVSHGAVSKVPLSSKFAATTLGFFPNYHLMSLKKRRYLERVLKIFISNHVSHELSIGFTPRKLSVVKSERNDHHTQFANIAPLMGMDGAVNISRKFISQRKPTDY